ncbi:MAG: type IX secretion system membrane protein PorP/SprF [Tunicatimonas sp.]
MKRIYLLSLLLTATSVCYGQQPFRFSQYFQNLIAVNPAVAGIEDFTDLKVGYRQQWTGVNGSPQTFYLSAHAPLAAKPREFTYQNNALRISDPSAFGQLETQSALGRGTRVRHGIGGYVINDQQSVFQQTQAFLTYAAHLPIGARTRLSLGASAGINNRRIDASGITLPSQNDDDVINRILSQSDGATSFDLNLGLFLYAENYYLGYSVDRILRNPVATGVADSEDARQNLYHYGLLGGRFRLSNSFMLLPGAFVGVSEVLPVTYDLNLRLRYQETVWVGASYRNSGTIAAMLGLNISNQFNINYAYDYGLGAVSDFRSGTHEIVLGFTLFNQQDSAPYLW